MKIWAVKTYKIDWIRSRISYRDTVLDVGCADRLVWGNSPINVIGLDKRVNRTHKEGMMGGEVCIPDVCGVAEYLPFRDNSFGIVCLSELLEHVLDPAKVIKEAIRVAKLKVIITVPWEEIWAPEHKPFTHIGHLRFYTPDSFIEELGSIGLPFQINPIVAEGMAWVCAEIYCCGKKWI